ncbi:hypothetical protein ACFWH4_26385 [Streptomyces sp. NPDC127091]
MLSAVTADGTTADGTTADGSFLIDEIARKGARFERDHLVERPEAVAA